jgi:hypothetical protein
MKSFDNGLETLVIKYTLGAAFLGVTLLFVGKLGALLFTVAKIKLVALKAWLLSGEFLGDLAQALKEAVFGGGK